MRRDIYPMDDSSTLATRAIVSRRLAYAENRDQNPAEFLANSGGYDDLLDWTHFTVMAGDPSYIAIADGDRALEVICLLNAALKQNRDTELPGLPGPYLAVVCKHGNPCGAAMSWESPVDAVRKTMLGDPLAVMGGELMVNFPVSDEVANEIATVPPELVEKVGREKWGTDVVYAPSFSRAAIELLGKKAKRRLLANPALANPVPAPDECQLRSVRGGFLRQKCQTFIPNLRGWALGNRLSPAEMETLLLAWVVCWRAVSNTVALAKDGMLIGLGCGQQDRIACVQLAIDRAKRAGHKIKGAFFVSDAFFPYARRKMVTAPLEGPELLVGEACRGGIVPGDGKELENVQTFFRDSGLLVHYLDPEHRGFRH